MSDTPKFTVVDRRKFRADEDSSPSTESKSTAAEESAAPPTSPSPGPPSPGPASPGPASPGPRLVEPIQSVAKPEPPAQTVAVAEEEDFGDEAQLPPAPTEEESRFQKTAYDQAAERLDNLVRAQNPGAPAQEKIGFEHLAQQLYLSAMMQMGAGTPEGQRPRIDILGARQTIDLLAVLQEKTKGNLVADEARMLDTVLYELRMTFLELTRMISTQPPIPPPPGAKR
jgi:Domain of unknown function (DUF1844)